MKISEEFIQEINQHIKDSLNEWSDILVKVEDNELGYLLEFGEEDLLNVLSIFMNIWSNSAIKRGVFTDDNVICKVTLLQNTIDDVFGVKTVKLTDSVLGNNISELN